MKGESLLDRRKAEDVNRRAGAPNEGKEKRPCRRDGESREESRQDRRAMQAKVRSEKGRRGQTQRQRKKEATAVQGGQKLADVALLTDEGHGSVPW